MILVHVTTVPQSLNFVRGQVRYMKASGFEVEVISSPGPRLAAFGREEDVSVHAVEMQRRITPWDDVTALGALCQVLQRVRPTIVHAHTPKGGLLGMLAAWLAQVPIRIYHMRGLPCLTARGSRRVILRTSELVSCATAHRVIAISPSIASTAVKIGLCPAEKITVLHNGGNGLDALGLFNPNRYSGGSVRETRARFNVPMDASVVGFVGRVVRDKGIGELVRAWLSLREEYLDLHLLVVGPLESQDPVPAQVYERMVSDPRVHLAGRMEKREVPAILAAMDILALPSHREGLPNVPLEAGAMGLPVVATDIPGCVDAVVDGVTGILVPPHDPSALARAIARYLADPELRRRHGQAGRERVLRAFRPHDIWEATLQEYIRLLRARGFCEPKEAKA